MKVQNHSAATKAVDFAAKSWFVVAVIGQMIFACYVLMLYWKSAALGDFERWNAASSHFYVKGDLLGNAIFGLHVALAAIITILGPIQLVPQVRSYAPRFHRVSGRIYIASAFIISLAGLYLSWIKGSVGGLEGSVVITMNAVIIMICAFFAVKNAIRRNIASHNQWAVHLFLAMSGVWLFRVFLMLWIMAWQAPVGFDPETFTGPFLNFLGFMVYVFPQAIVAFYFLAKKSQVSATKWAFSGLVFLITIGTALGIVAATMGLWVPRM
ncbi:MAG: DUF2306 domain-containing protein [Imperialibacter sp.]|uniref:DUF2306 domain-containing protein n=1 Tax=Imperialibacter sp. TaxID=2038411 RepID=UPI0032EF07C7